jgi:hypothetical protein
LNSATAVLHADVRHPGSASRTAARQVLSKESYAEQNFRLCLSKENANVKKQLRALVPKSSHLEAIQRSSFAVAVAVRVETRPRHHSERSRAKQAKLRHALLIQDFLTHLSLCLKFSFLLLFLSVCACVTISLPAS